MHVPIASLWTMSIPDATLLGFSKSHRVSVLFCNESADYRRQLLVHHNHGYAVPHCSEDMKDGARAVALIRKMLPVFDCDHDDRSADYVHWTCDWTDESRSEFQGSIFCDSRS